MPDQPTIHPQHTDLAFTREELRGTLIEPTYSGALSFLRRRYTRDLSGVDVAVVGAPFDLATTGRPGARFGPRAVREASAMLAWSSPYAWDFDPCERLAVIDYGDIWFDPGRPHEVPEILATAYAPILDAGALPLTLGGDHFVSFPVLQALSKRLGGPLSLIHFDAHSDTWDDENGRIDHGTMFFHAAQMGYVDPASSIQLGIRTRNPETQGFEVWDARRLHREGSEAAIAAVHARIGKRPCYVSFDIDFLDPSCAPGTGTPVAGGFTTHQALELIRGLAGLDVRGADVVEVAPAYDHAGITALAAASLAHELLCVLASHASRNDKADGT